MDIRLIIHYSDGHTFTGEWNIYHPFKDLNTELISSLQIQTDNNLYTLSSKKKQKCNFYSRQAEDYISILKEIYRDVWIELTIDKNTEEKVINVIKENIRTT